MQNKWSGLDVSTLDYIARDAFFTGWKSAVNIERFIAMARVIPNKGDFNKWCTCPPGNLELLDKGIKCKDCEGAQRHICLPEKVNILYKNNNC